jgi:tRNA uridine 5-carbamoylmethylation protein Kti12
MTDAAAFLVTGVPGAGKTTVALELAARLPRAAHVEADRLQEWIVSGRVWPHEDPRDEAMRQLDQRALHAACLANSYYNAGFLPVIDDIVVGPRRLGLFERELRPHPLGVVVLAPTIEVALERDRRRGYKRVGDRWAHLDRHQRARLGHVGLWLDTGDMTPQDTVDAILERYRPIEPP